jgi:hypothetical protein
MDHVQEVGRAIIVLLAFALEPLRRLTRSHRWAGLERWVAPALLLAAAFLIVRWGAEPSPQRMSLADLAAGKLSPTQTWIVLSGELSEAPADALGGRVYNLTDRSAPQASLLVRSDRPRDLGPTTISGQLTGWQLQPDGVSWWGQLQADDRLALDSPPPWAALALALAGVLVLVARRTTYPVYFSDKPADRPGRTGAVPVTVRSLAGRQLEASPRAVLEHESDGAPAVLAVEGMEPIPLAFHSPTTGIDVGELRELGRSVPVLRLRPLAMDATIAFASRDDRDGAFAALTAATRQ